MSKASEAFATKHDIAATAEDVARIRRALSRFYTAVETAEPVADTYIQLHTGDSIRAAFIKHNPLSGQAHGVSMAITEMPEAWPPKYRASVAYHLAPLLDDVVNS
ncbi:hypothetical protein GOA55_13935 [Sinorhizobium meliloti]|nr:hypothetical protein [Sinorhizobium meliloti]